MKLKSSSAYTTFCNIFMKSDPSASYNVRDYTLGVHTNRNSKHSMLDKYTITQWRQQTEHQVLNGSCCEAPHIRSWMNDRCLMRWELCMPLHYHEQKKKGTKGGPSSCAWAVKDMLFLWYIRTCMCFWFHFLTRAYRWYDSSCRTSTTHCCCYAKKRRSSGEYELLPSRRW